jgi:hypothetical protein
MKKKSSGTKIQHLVPNNPEYDRATMDPEEVAAERRAIKNTLYDSSYRTAAGHWKRRDEPGEPRKTEYLTIDPGALRRQKQWDARQRLKKKDAVPTRKDGRKLFDQFMKEANTFRSKSISKKSKMDIKDLDALENLYNASGLTFQQWLILVADISKECSDIGAISR